MNDLKVEILTEKSIIENLNFMGQIAVGQKVSFKHKTIKNDNILTSLSRYWYEDKRQDGVQFTNSIILQLESYISKTEDIIKLVSLVDAISKSIIGINNLIKTYNDDKAIVYQYKLAAESLKFYRNDALNKIAEIQKPKYDIDIIPQCYIALFERNKQNNELIYPIIKSLNN